MSDSFFTDIDDVMNTKQAADQESFDAPKFDPQPGDRLDAILMKAEAFTKGEYEPTVILTFKNVGDTTVGGIEPGKSGVMFTPTVLRRQMLDAQPAIGRPFALRYEGMVTPEGGGYSFKNWTLVTAYMKTGDQNDIDPALWTGIARTMADNTVAPEVARVQNAKPGDSAWRF